MELVAFLGNDKENWGQVTALINHLEDCKKVVLVKSLSSDSFPASEKCIVFEVDTSSPIMKLKQELLDFLKKELSGDFEVALSLASGSGKEHMALVAALLSVPVGVSLVAYTKEGVKFLT